MQFPNHSLITYNIILEKDEKKEGEEGEKKEERNRKPANWRGKC